MVYRSRVIVKCGYEDFFWEGQRRLIKRHTDTKHPGFSVNENIESLDMDEEEVNPEVLHFLQTIDGSVSNDQDLSDDIDNEDDDLSDDGELDDELLGEEDDLLVEDEGKEEPEEESKGMSTRQSTSLSTSSNTALAAIALAKIHRQIRNLQRIKKIKDKQCRSLAVLAKDAEGMLQISPEDDMVFCKICCQRNNSGSVGLFPYNFSVGISFKAGETLPQEFRNLKSKIKRHFKSGRHANNCMKAKQQDEEALDRTSENIAMRVLRTAYYVMKSSRPHKEFCDLIHLQSLNGMNMGDINHSASLIGKLRDAIHEDLMIQIRSELSSSELSNDLRLLSDLTYARSSQSIPFCAKLMYDAIERLKQRKIIPSHMALTELCCQKVCCALKEYKPHHNYISNEELFKYAWDKSGDVLLKTYMDMVVRLWLLNPGENLVESLSIVIKNIFGHRHLEQANAIKELVIKWNGPALNAADPLLESIQKRLKLKFRRITRRGKTDQGTVLSHYRTQKPNRPHGSSGKKNPNKGSRKKKKPIVPPPPPEPMNVPPPPMPPMNCYQQEKINRAAADAVAMSRQMCVPTMTSPPDQSMTNILHPGISIGYTPSFFYN